MIGETVKPGGDAEFRKSHGVTFDLPDGVTKMQSHRYQEAASVPEPEFLAHVARVRMLGGHVAAPALILTVGLVLDILGVLLIFRYWLGPAVQRGGHSALLLEGDDPEEAAKAQRYDCLSKVGVVMVVLGFVLQIVAVWV